MSEFDLTMWGRENQRGGSVGLTDRTTPDLNGIVAPLQLGLLMPVRRKRVCLGVQGAKPPPGFPILVTPRCA